MGFLDWLLGRPQPSAVVSPYATGGDLVQLTIKELYGDIDPQIITQDIASRVPGFKRALAAHCGLIGGLQFRQYEYDQIVTPQPAWLNNSQSGRSPYLRWLGVTQDMFWWRWAVLGMEMGDQGPADAIHIPYGLWSTDSEGNIVVDEDKVPARYRDHFVAIDFGLNGVLQDGVDTIRSARYIESAWQDRIANPIAQTDLHITDPTLSVSRKEKLKLAEQYNAGRALPGGSTSVTDAFIDVKHHDAPADLFESGRNAVRLDIANHALVPASVIEGAKNGSAGELNYSNDSTKRNELYDFGTGLFVNAIAARLSMDDVCRPGQSIRPDLAGIQAPTPTLIPVED